MKRRFQMIAALLALTAALLLSGCGGQEVPEPGVVPGEAPYTLTLPENELTSLTYAETFLPKPTAKNGAGGDVSGEVTVEVLKEDGRVFVPACRYELSPSFTPVEAGRYYAVYAVKNAAGAVACQRAAVITVTDETRENAGITVDGVLNDARYAASPAYETGVANGLRFKYYFAKEGVYLGVDVADAQLVYSDYVAAKFTQSDGFELFLNFSEERSDLLNDKCFKVQATVGGEVRFYSASTGKTVYELNERIRPEYRLQVRGTRTAVGDGNAASYYDADTGYTFETYLPYRMLGIERAGDKVGVAFAHRDVTSASPALAAKNGAANRYFQDVALPAGITQVMLDNGKNYAVSDYDAYALTELYHTLWLTGEHRGVAAPQSACAVTLDGVVAEAAWEGAEAFTVGGAAVKAFRDGSGLYVHIGVTDTAVFASASENLYAGDCVQLRVAVGNTLTSNELPKGVAGKGRMLTLSPAGAAQKSFLNAGALLFTGGYDVGFYAGETEDGYAVELFLPAYALGLQPGVPVGISVGVIDNNGRDATAFADFAFSSRYDDPSSYRVIGGER